MKYKFKLKAEIFNKTEMNRALQLVANAIVEQNSDLENLVIIGIKRRGFYLAQRIIKFIKTLKNIDVPLGELEIKLYRDDLSEVAQQPLMKSVNISVGVTNKHVVLVDDVLYTGRTILAALDEILHLWHPDKIELAVLIDRGHRRLPIQPDFIGKKITTTAQEIVEVQVPEIDGYERVLLVEK